MPEYDFKTISAVIAGVIGPSALLTFKDIFEKPLEPATDLLTALKDTVSPPSLIWVRNRREKVLRLLLSIPLLILSVFYFVVMVIVGVLLIGGPDRILDPARWGFLAEPLTSGEKLVYAILLVPTVAVYIWRVLHPIGKGWSAVIRATLWIRRR